MRAPATILLLAALWVLFPMENFGMNIPNQEAKSFVDAGSQGTSTSQKNKTDIADKQNGSEQFNTSHSLKNSFYILTSSHFSLGSRVDTRTFVDAFFISFFDYVSLPGKIYNDNSNYQSVIVQHSLKLIYPYHSFW